MLVRRKKWDPPILDPTYDISNEREASGWTIIFLSEWLYLWVLQCNRASLASIAILPTYVVFNFERPKFSLSLVPYI